MSTITIEVDDNRLRTLEARATDAGVAIEDFVRDAVDAYVDLTEQGPVPPPLTDDERAQIEAAIEDVRAGRVRAHADVMAAARARIAR